MADVFISYKREDRERIAPLARALEARGYTVWWDLELVPSQKFERQIFKELDAAKCVIVVWTAKSIDDMRLYASDWINTEANAGDARGILLPVQLDADRTHRRHSDRQFADLVGWRGEQDHSGLEALFKGLEALMGARPTPAEQELIAWQQAERAEMAEGFKRFLEAYPQSRFADIARGRIAELEEVSAWQALGATPTIAALAAFLRRFPAGRFADDAEAKIRATGQTNPPLAVSKPGRRVFVSYPRDIAPELMMRIVSALLERGFVPWVYDPNSFEFTTEQLAIIQRQRTGEGFEAQTKEAAHSADAVLFLISPWTLQSKFQMGELAIAWRRERCVPCIVSDELEQEKLPRHLRNTHVLKLTPSVIESASGLGRLTALIDDVAVKAGQSPWAIHSKILRRRGAIFAGAAGLALVALLAWSPWNRTNPPTAETPPIVAEAAAPEATGPAPSSASPAAPVQTPPETIPSPTAGAATPPPEPARAQTPEPEPPVAAPSIPLPDMVRIPGQNFEAGRYEVTFAEWDACVAAGGCNGHRPDDRGWGRGRRPVISVSWNDAQAYVQWLSQRTGRQYRLLTEREWEIAARAGTTTEYSWGDDPPVCDQNARNGANFNECTDDRTRPVGSFQPNGFGLYDVHGNVWEFVQDAEGTSRVLRGGSWSRDPDELRSAYRNWINPTIRYSDYGFRLARTL